MFMVGVGAVISGVEQENITFVLEIIIIYLFYSFVKSMFRANATLVNKVPLIMVASKNMS